MSNAPKAVFLSYASQDAEAARQICDALRAAGIDVWFDQSELRGGDAWDASIRRQIKECALFVPVISANTQSRSEGYFRLEWKLAIDRSHLMADDQAFLLPVVIDTTIDANARVPEKFREVQWTHLPAGRAPAAFAEHVRGLLSGACSPAPTTPTRAVASAKAEVAVTAPAPESSSIAVLPFVNRSSSQEDEYFSDGLADELLNVLAKIRGLRVAARTSAFSFKGRQATIAEVGRALNVATVLEGSVRKAGSRMRISVQLVNVADGYHLWSETYDRIFDDIFAVQDDIAQSVVTQLRTMLLGEESASSVSQEVTAQVAAAAKGRATDPEAHRLFLQARFFFSRNNRQDTATAIGYINQALALDPDFALAWSELGGLYADEAAHGWVPLAEGLARAREKVERALALEPELAEAHAQKGWIQSNTDWNWAGAQASFRRALELAPGNARVVNAAGTLALIRGRLEEATRLYRQALDQDPLRPVGHLNLAYALRVTGRFAEAEAEYRKALELAPQRAVLHAAFSLILLAQGRSAEALDEALREPEEWARLWVLAIIHHADGRRAESEAALQALISNHQDEAACQVAQAYAVRGELDRAFQWLELAYEKRDPGLAYVKIEQAFHSLHPDPRWQAFLRKMGLAD